MSKFNPNMSYTNTHFNRQQMSTKVCMNKLKSSKNMCYPS